MRTTTKRNIARHAAALMIALLVIPGIHAKTYATGGEDIVIDGNSVPVSYSNSKYSGFNGNGTMGLSVPANMINSIKTVNEGVEGQVTGVLNDDKTLSIGSLIGGIDVQVNGNYVGSGICNRNFGEVKTTIEKMGNISVTASAGVANAISNDRDCELTVTSCLDTMTIKAVGATIAYSIENSGTLNLGENGKTIQLVGNVFNYTIMSSDAVFNLAGTTNVTGNVENTGILNLTGTMTVSGNVSGAGTIVVDMSFVDSNSKPDKVVLIDCEGTADYGTYKLATGKENGYQLAVEGKDLVANLVQQTVTFNTRGGSTAPETQTVIEGGKVTKPEDPTKEGATFAGWFFLPTGADMGIRWDFDDGLYEDGTMIATWIEIIEGKDQTIDTTKVETAAFKSNDSFSNFVGIKVDGKDVKATNYEVKEGSIIVTLKKDYLSTLSDGDHTLAIISTNGKAECKFSISGNVAKTGDENNIWFYSVLGMLAIGAAGALLAMRKKESR